VSTTLSLERYHGKSSRSIAELRAIYGNPVSNYFQTFLTEKNIEKFSAVAEKRPGEERERSFNMPPNIKNERKYFSRTTVYELILALASLLSSVADPNPNWIRIQSGQWIRIRIRNPDPDPRGQK
jgi:hypothetical protein